MSTERTLKYRADIDGLRAVAVIAVLVFHIIPDLLPGGYAGVDVFFVISGYLISSILIKEIRQNSFSILRFYERRVRRLFPALIFVLAFVFLCGWLFMFPDEFILLGKHIASAVIYTSNFTLQRESGYFDISAAYKPLLHLWSLAIEEQFYLFWPWIILFIHQKKKSLFLTATGLAVVSFLGNLFYLHFDKTGAFYWSPVRFWEIMIGCALAFKGTRSSNTGNAQSIIGLFLVLISFILLNDSTLFPGFWALLPCIGSYLIISSDNNSLINKNFLSNNVLVYIGKISYPLYLWHWPIVTYMRLIAPFKKDLLIFQIVAILLSFLMAAFTFHFIEKPIHKYKIKRLVPVLLASWIIIGIVGYGIKKSNGIPSRVSSDMTEMLRDVQRDTVDGVGPFCPGDLKDSKPELNFCRQTKSGDPNAAIFGDSHAGHLFPGISYLDHQRTWLLIGNSSCPPVLDVNIQTDTKNCKQREEKMISYLERTDSIKTIVISFFAEYFQNKKFAADHIASHSALDKFGNGTEDLSERQKIFTTGLQNMLTRLKKTKKKIIIFIDVPELPFFPKDCIPRTEYSAQAFCRIDKSIVNSRQHEFMEIVKQLKEKNPEIKFFEPNRILCDSHYCYAKHENFLLYRDSHHLSVRGSIFIGKYFLNFYKDFIQ